MKTLYFVAHAAIFAALEACSLSVSAQAQVAIGSNATILVTPDQAAPIAEAARDLAADMLKVFGRRPRIVSQYKGIGYPNIVVGEQSTLPPQLRPTDLVGPESFSISVRWVANKKSRPAPVVVLAGTDVRGTIYAVYHFSEQFLGVDPMYYWTDREPTKTEKIVLESTLNLSFPSPIFRYRGLFINDEDLLTGWSPGAPHERTGIALATWNKVFETILRLKGNIVAPGTWIFPDEEQVRLAGRRGLVITQHHATPLGMNVARWPSNVPYSYVKNPEILRQAWRNAANSYAPGQEVLWTVGLRGLSDMSYADTDQSVGDDRALGSLVSRAMADQMAVVRSLRSNAEFITLFWDEGVHLAQNGFLSIPSGVTRVWGDDGYGNLPDSSQVRRGDGVYYHVAVESLFANQLTEMVPVERVEAQLGRYIDAGATMYLLLNTSDIRPVVMTTTAAMNVAWRGNDSSRLGFYDTWSSKQFGPRATHDVTAVYKEYFAALTPMPTEPSWHEYGDNYYHTVARALLLIYMDSAPIYALSGQGDWPPSAVLNEYYDIEDPDSAAEGLKTVIRRCEDELPRWDKLWKHAQEAQVAVLPERRPFYQAQVLTMIQINRESNRILYLVATAIEKAREGRTREARETAKQAFAAFDEISKAQRSAEYGKWKNWYRGDWLVGIERTRQLLQEFLRYLDDPFVQTSPPVIWSDREAYQHILKYQGSRRVDVR